MRSFFFITICIIVLLSMFHYSSRAQSFLYDIIKPHNMARGAVRVPSIARNTTLENYAKEYANKRIGDCSLVRSRGPYGENLAWSSGDSSFVDAVNQWVAERAFYDLALNSCTPGKVCEHYTQVIWRNLVHVGCVRVKCDNKKGTFVICSYAAPGNIPRQHPLTSTNN